MVGVSVSEFPTARGWGPKITDGVNDCAYVSVNDRSTRGKND